MSLTSVVSNTSSSIPANIIVIESFIVLSQGSLIIPNISNILFPVWREIFMESRVTQMIKVRIF